MMRIYMRFFGSLSKRKTFLQQPLDQRTLDHLDRLGLGYVSHKQIRKAVAIKYRQIGMGKGPGLGYKYLDESAEHPFPFDRGAKQVRMIDVANSIAELPDYGAAPEVALIGRSNVGKSTLLNALMGFKSHQIEAKVSDKPGETKSLHFYAMGKPRHRGPPALVVVDMPGYGFAFMDEETQKHIFDLSAMYLLSRGPALKRVLLVVDARHGIKIGDTNFFASLNELVKGKSRPDWRLQVVLTKCDMVSRDDLARRAQEVQDSLRDKLASIALSNLPIIMVSGLERKGIIDLHRELASLVPRKEKTVKIATAHTDVAPGEDKRKNADLMQEEKSKPTMNANRRTEDSARAPAIMGSSIGKTDRKTKEIKSEKNEGKPEIPRSESKKSDIKQQRGEDRAAPETSPYSSPRPTSRVGSPDSHSGTFRTGNPPSRAGASERDDDRVETESPRRTVGRRKKTVLLRRMEELSLSEDDEDEDHMFEGFDDMPEEDPRTPSKGEARVDKAGERKLSETLKPNPITKRNGHRISKTIQSKSATKSPFEDVVGAPIESGDVPTLDIGSRLSAILEHYEKLSTKQELAKPAVSATREAPDRGGGGSKPPRFTGAGKSPEELEQKMKRKEMYVKKFAKKNRE